MFDGKKVRTEWWMDNLIEKHETCRRSKLGNGHEIRYMVVQVGDVPSDSVAVGSFDWWSGCGNDMFQNRYQTQDSFEMRKIDPRSGIYAEM
jgi:hypothetical protein